LGDIHFGSDDISLSHLKDAIAEINDTPNAYWIGMGDYIDFARATARRYLQAYTGDETSLRILDKIAGDFELDLWQRYLKPIAPRCLGLIEGNHTWITDHGISTAQRLSERMGCPYLSDMGGLNLSIRAKNGKHLKTLKIVAHHGDFGGSASTPGGDLNSMVRHGQAWLVDVNLFAHSHKKVAYHQPVLTWATRGKLEIEEIPHVYVRTGSFTRAYRETDERGRYTERKMLNPAELGHVAITVQFYQEKSEGVLSKAQYRIKCTA
jgi:hypothetical protein